MYSQDPLHSSGRRRMGLCPSWMDQIKAQTLRDSEAFEWTMRYKIESDLFTKAAQHIEYTDATYTKKTIQPKWEFGPDYSCGMAKSQLFSKCIVLLDEYLTPKRCLFPRIHSLRRQICQKKMKVRLLQSGITMQPSTRS
jgi:hypothetical protein